MTDEAASGTAPVIGEELPPATRRRLQQCFDYAMQRVKANEYDAATELLFQCVNGDPANKQYVQAYLSNLQKKYNNNKKGSNFAGLKNMGPKGKVKKALADEDWAGVFREGFEALKLNPWDFTTLTAMAEAADMSYLDELELIYLKAAQDADPKDPAINRLCAFAMARRGAYDQAIKCWHMVEVAKKNDPEAKKAISDLQSEKVFRRHGAVGGAEAGKIKLRASDRKRPPPPAWYKPKGAEKAQEADSSGPAKVELTPEQRLRQAISLNPEDIQNYVQLAQLFSDAHEFDKAEEELLKAVSISNSDILAVEPLEELRLRRGKYDLARAEKKAQKDGSPANLELVKKAKTELLKLDIEIHRDRSDRQPRDMAVKVELGTRYKRAGAFQEAAKCFQEALVDAEVKGVAHLELGECFRHLKQYKAAVENYTAAIENLAFRDDQLEQRKQALYLAGVVTAGLKDFDAAERHFKDLIGLDAKYKDAADRLDKIAQVRNKG